MLEFAQGHYPTHAPVPLLTSGNRRGPWDIPIVDQIEERICNHDQMDKTTTTHRHLSDPDRHQCADFDQCGVQYSTIGVDEHGLGHPDGIGGTKKESDFLEDNYCPP